MENGSEQALRRDSARWAAALGWGHSGYVADRRAARLWLLALLAIPFLLNLSAVLRTPAGSGYVDFYIFHRAAEEFARHPQGPIYEVRPNYLYPPFFITIFAALLALPAKAALCVFQVAKWIALYGCLRMTFRLCAPRGEDVPPIVALGCLLLCFRYFNNELLNGNINVFVLALVLAAALLHADGRSGWAGFLAGVAACVKVTPALFLVYLIVKRPQRALPGAVLAGLVCLLVWPAIFIGWSDSLRLLGEWYEHMIAGYLARGAVWSAGINQSLTSIINRFFGDAVAIPPDTFITIVRLPAPLLAVLRAALAALVLAALAWACRGRGEPKPGLTYASEVALVLVAMLLLSGYTWKAHYIAAALPYSVILAYLADARLPQRPRRTVLTLLVLSFILMSLSGELFTPHGADLMLAYGVVAASGIAAGIAVFIIRDALRGTTTP